MIVFLYALVCLALMPESLTPAAIFGKRQLQLNLIEYLFSSFNCLLIEIEDQSKISEMKCDLFELRTIKGENNEVIDTYCRCNDGSYGFSCQERHANPCIGNVRFEISPDNIPDNYFIHCDNNVPYLFKCPVSTKWNHSLFTCSSLSVNPSEYMELFQAYVEKKTGKFKVNIKQEYLCNFK
jgi:hypothetical protein